MSEKLAVVTGTSSGIGLAVARFLVDSGWQVFGIARRPGPISHPRYRHRQADLGDLAALERLLDREIGPLVAEARWSAVGLVNNAARATLLGPTDRVTAHALAGNHAVNLIAPIAIMAAVSRSVPRETQLRIVNVSSGAARLAFLGLAAYCSAKAGLRSAGMVLAAEWASDVAHAPRRPNAALLSYEPGVVDTELQTEARETAAETFPWVGMFLGFKASGSLVPPDGPAAEIVRFLDASSAPAYSEARFGGTSN